MTASRRTGLCQGNSAADVRRISPPIAGRASSIVGGPSAMDRMAIGDLRRQARDKRGQRGIMGLTSLAAPNGGSHAHADRCQEPGAAPAGCP